MSCTAAASATSMARCTTTGTAGATSSSRGCRTGGPGRAWTDVETCYKLIRRDLLQRIAPSLQERGFGIELELAAKLARQPGVRFYERPVSYVGRSWADGKKIGVKDGLWAMWCILRY